MNELRAKLGLEPLRDTPTPASQQPPATEEAREKTKEKEESPEEAEDNDAAAQLGATESLGSMLAREERFGDALRWVERSRELQRNREAAAKQRPRLTKPATAAAISDALAAAARLARELDARDTAETATTSEQQQQQQQVQYTSEHLAGLHVAHSLDAFSEGTEAVLTLRDAPVIGDSEDVLENVAITAEERRLKAIADSKPREADKYGDWEFERQPDGSAVFDPHRRPSVLSKYDVVVESSQGKTAAQSGFIIGQPQQQREDDAEAIRQRLQRAAAGDAMVVDASGSMSSTQSEFYTREELAAFRKHRPPKRGRKRDADETAAAAAAANSLVAPKLEPGTTATDTVASATVKVEKTDGDAEMAADEGIDQAAEHGSRRTRGEQQRQQRAADALREMEARQKNYEKALRRAREASRALISSNTGDVDDAELEDELYRSLATERTKKQQQTKKPTPEEFALAAIRAHVKEEPAADVDVDDGSSCLVVSEMSEFVHGLRPTETEQLETQPVAGVASSAQDAASAAQTSPTSKTTSTASAVDGRSDKESEEDNDEEEEDVDDDDTDDDDLLIEPLVSEGVAATLRRLQQLGGVEKMEAVTRVQIGRKKDGEFPLHDPNDPAPHLKLEYLDSDGRQLRPKEAFRQLSYIFHGRKPGKRKLAKLQRRIEEEIRRRDMQSTDTPLNAVAALKQVQTQTKSPYLVLTGQGVRNQLLSATADLKRKIAKSKQDAPAAKKQKPSA